MKNNRSSLGRYLLLQIRMFFLAGAGTSSRGRRIARAGSRQLQHQQIKTGRLQALWGSSATF
jgi:hypothetical protein